MSFFDDLEDYEFEPYFVVGFDLPPGENFGIMEMTEKVIEAFMNDRGYEDFGSGSGFGDRDLEFGRGDGKVPTDEEAAEYAAALNKICVGRNIRITVCRDEEDAENDNGQI